MPVVHIPSHMRDASGGRATVEVSGSNVRQVLESLEAACPGISSLILDGGRVRGDLAVAVDSTITENGLLEPVGPDSEVHLVPSIAGG